jgi:hypothetical protein
MGYFDGISIEKGIDVYYLFNHHKGIDIIFDLDSKVKAIHFYSGKQDISNKFTDRLPLDVDFSCARNDVRQLLGTPNLTGGGNFSFLYGTTPPWDKYFFDDFKLHLQYSPDETNIELVTIES